MRTKIVVGMSAALLSSSALAAFINAADFSPGQNVSHLTDNVELRWLTGTGNAAESVMVYSAGTNIYGADANVLHPHFGGVTGDYTWEENPMGIFSELMGSTEPHKYSALEVSFLQPVRSFGYRAQPMSDVFAIYLFDAAGTYREKLEEAPLAIGRGDSGFLYDITRSYTFDFDVGRILLASEQSAAYVYAIEVPEPLPVVLLGLGLLAVLSGRRAIVDRRN